MFTAEFIEDVSSKMNSGEYGTLALFKLFLDRKAEVDDDFRHMYAQESKFLENCWKYITMGCLHFTILASTFRALKSRINIL